MVKRMLIDATHAEETRVVVLDGTHLEELDYETSTKKQVKGNIYFAKVMRVEPSLQAAFVEYGGNRHGFLAFDEIHPDYYRIPAEDRAALIAEARREIETKPEPEPPPAAASEGEMAFENDGEGEALNAPEVLAPEILDQDEGLEELPRRASRSLRHYKIQDVVARRQVMLVQVIKEERGGKGAALTTYLSLAGRYCVLMPNTPRSGGISRKITDPDDRRRLKSMLDEFEIPEGMAVIVRTAGMARPKSEVRRDYEYLLRLWDDIRTRTLACVSTALVHEEGDIVKRAIRDLYSRDIDEIQVAGEPAYENARSFMKMMMPSYTRRVQLYRDPIVPIFHRYQVEAQLELIHNPVVHLKSGGYIVINPTEALVAIDVNSGRATKERHIEETAIKTNLEAATEIARQVRLRDLAGLIVIDFIDMEERRNNNAVERCLKEMMKSDRARIQIGRISAFGLLELSRQRLRPSLLEASSEQCRYCQGTGTVRSIESTALHVLRAIEEEGIKARTAELQVTVTTAVALYILNQKRAALADIEARHYLTVIIERDDLLIPPNFRLERLRNRLPGEIMPPPVFVPAPPVELEEDILEEEEAAVEEPVSQAAESEENSVKRKRRRRNRRRRTGDAVEDSGMIEAAESSGNAAMADARDPNVPVAEAAADNESEAEGEAETEIGNGNENENENENGVETEAVELGEDGLPRRSRRRGRRGGRRRGRRGEEAGSDAENAGEAIPVSPLTAAESTAVEAHEPAAPELAVTEAAPSPVAAETPTETPVAKPRRRAPRKTAAPPEKTQTPEALESAQAPETIALDAPPAVAPESDTPPPARKRVSRSPARERKPRSPASEGEPQQPPVRAPRKRKQPEAKAETAPVASSGETTTPESGAPGNQPAKPPRRGWWGRATG